MAAVLASIVFGFWFPFPYSELSGGRNLFLIIVVVDAVCGPLLTLVIFDVQKPKAELRRDIAVVVILQFAALAYGVHTVLQARPVFLAFEGNRFRLVRSLDVDESYSKGVAQQIRPGLGRPQLIGARTSKPTDPDFPENIKLALNGLHPAFRPDRWVPYAEVQAEALAESKPLPRLQDRVGQADAGLIKRFVSSQSLPINQLRFMPLVSDATTSWIVVLNNIGQPVGYLPIDGWD